MTRIALSLAIVFSLVSSALPALGATITVTTTVDELTTNGQCSLREAIRAANLDTAVDACAAGTGTDEIVLPPGIYTLSIPATNDNAALDGDLDVTGTVTIVGAGADTTVIEACAVAPPATACTGIDRVFEIRPGADVTIRGVTIRHGTAFQNGVGGGIFNQGTLALTESVVSDNVSGLAGGGLRNAGAGARATVTGTIIARNRAPSGGGISSLAPLALAASLVSDNTATAGFGLGGGIHNNGVASVTDSAIARNTANAGAGLINQISGSMTISGSTLHDNGGAENGGAIENDGTLTLVNSTVSGNRADENGAGIFNIGLAASLSLVNTTVTANTTRGQGGGLRVVGGTVTLRHTILADNVDSDAVLRGHSPDCSGAVISHGHNLIGIAGTLVSGVACTGVADGVNADQVGTAIAPIDPRLTPLGDHGGATPTHALSSDSPAVDAGTPGGCADETGAPLAVDQRGFIRPVGPACDIGAFEGVVASTAAPAAGHFLCYKAQTTVRTPPFPGVYGVRLVDAFESRLFDVRTASRLCNPADTEHGGVTDPDTHLEGYEITLSATRPTQPGHVSRGALLVENRFGSLTVDTLKPERLLVPTAKSLTGPIAPPVAGAHGVDHYKCYLVRVSRGTPAFQRRDVTVSDQFTAAKLFEVQDLLELCVPVDKQGEGVGDPAAHLACYRAKPAAAHVPVGGIHVSNQFGAERLDVLRDVTLCVPSTVAYSGPDTGSGPPAGNAIFPSNGGQP